MAGTPFTRELYDRMTVAFREFPGNASATARALNVDRRMTTRGWKTGWPRYDWARPICDVIAEERAAARAQMQKLHESAADEAVAQRDADREASIRAHTEEERIMEIARKDVVGALVISAELVPAMRTLGKLVIDAVRGETIPPSKALDLISRHAQLTSKAVHAADAIVKLGRLSRGQPGAIVGMQPGTPTPDETLTYEEAVEELENAADLLALVKETGTLPPEIELALIEGEGMQRGDGAPPSTSDDAP